MIHLHSNSMLLSGTAGLPASKSISNRALIIKALTGNEMTIQNLADCDDTNVLQRWLADRPAVVDVGAAGTSMRFSTALLCLQQGAHVITGSERMKNRPISFLVDALRQLGASIDYLEKDGFPPLRIHGNPSMKGGVLTMSGDVSSQFVSALLLIAPVLKNGLTITLQGKIVSRPYIDLTIQIMRQFGSDAFWMSENVLRVNHQPYVPVSFKVENDWTAASYWYELVALAANHAVVQLPGLSLPSVQGDASVADIFRLLGVMTKCQLNHGEPVLSIEKEHTPVKNLHYDLSNNPDLAQTIAVTCCMMNITFRLTGLSTLRVKETDRLEALKTELSKLGFLVEILGDDCLQWNGERSDVHDHATPPIIDTYEDHRMAMAFAPCVLKIHQLDIRNPQVVSKSYPLFWQELSNALS